MLCAKLGTKREVMSADWTGYLNIYVYIYIMHCFQFSQFYHYVNTFNNVFLHPIGEPVYLETQYNREVLFHHILEIQYNSSYCAGADEC